VIFCHRNVAWFVTDSIDDGGKDDASRNNLESTMPAIFDGGQLVEAA
jgi:hypothetical protein